MKITIEALVRGLTEQLAEIDTDLVSLKTKIRELKASRRQVAAALRAIGGVDSSGRPSRPAPTKKQVMRVLRALMAENDGAVPVAELETLVAKRLSNRDGCSAAGLALRLRECFKSGAFAVDGGTARLKTENPQTPTTTADVPERPYARQDDALAPRGDR